VCLGRDVDLVAAGPCGWRPQVRRRLNKLPGEREFAILEKWQQAGGPVRSEYLVPRY
jgi:hypothetical protein